MNGSLIAFVIASTIPVLVCFIERFDIKFIIWDLRICIWLVDLKYLKLCKISIIYFAKLPFISADWIENRLTRLFNFLKKYNKLRANKALIKPIRQVIINAKEMYINELIIKIPTVIKKDEKANIASFLHKALGKFSNLNKYDKR